MCVEPVGDEPAGGSDLPPGEFDVIDGELDELCGESMTALIRHGHGVMEHDARTLIAVLQNAHDGAVATQGVAVRIRFVGQFDRHASSVGTTAAHNLEA